MQQTKHGVCSYRPRFSVATGTTRTMPVCSRRIGTAIPLPRIGTTTLGSVASARIKQILQPLIDKRYSEKAFFTVGYASERKIS